MADRREDEEEDANPTAEEVSFKSLVNTFPASQYYVIPRWFYLVDYGASFATHKRLWSPSSYEKQGPCRAKILLRLSRIKYPRNFYPCGIKYPRKFYPGGIKYPRKFYPGGIKQPRKFYPGGIKHPRKFYPGGIKHPRKFYPGGIKYTIWPGKNSGG